MSETQTSDNTSIDFRRELINLAYLALLISNSYGDGEDKSNFQLACYVVLGVLAISSFIYWLFGGVGFFRDFDLKVAIFCSYMNSSVILFVLIISLRILAPIVGYNVFLYYERKYGVETWIKLETQQVYESKMLDLV